MATTPIYGLPYPAGTDKILEGDDAMQALALAVEDRIRSSSGVAQLELANNGSTLTASAVTINHLGAQTFMAGFSYAGGVLTYAGPLRLFIVATEVEVQVASAGTIAIESAVYLLRNGVSIAGSFDDIQIPTATLEGRQVVHRITTPVQLTTGDTLGVTASCSPNGTAGLTGLRVYPIGPSAS